MWENVPLLRFAPESSISKKAFRYRPKSIPNLGPKRDLKTENRRNWNKMWEIVSLLEFLRKIQATRFLYSKFGSKKYEKTEETVLKRGNMFLC